MAQSTQTTFVARSRAVLRRVEAGCTAVCARCEEAVKFAAREHRYQVIANVYENGKWNRVEHFHSGCYEDAGAPYGEAAA